MESESQAFECILHANHLPRPAHSLSKRIELKNQILKIENSILAVNSFPLYVLEHMAHHKTPIDSELLERIVGEEFLANQVYEDAVAVNDFGVLKKIIIASDQNSFNIAENVYAFIVAPRTGTISPWSSKATDILNRCGISKDFGIARIERAWIYFVHFSGAISSEKKASICNIFHDRMTQSVSDIIDSRSLAKFKSSFVRQQKPRPLKEVDIISSSSIEEAENKLKAANVEFGLALALDEISYIVRFFKEIKRNPTDVELMMFAQVNSEHCRHKIFNASWEIDGTQKPYSLFGMIKNTYKKHPEHILSAYSDNAAVLTGPIAGKFQPYAKADGLQNSYEFTRENIHMICKVETHNHPTAVSPFEGAATGSGGEIRDEGAVGTGSKPKAGLVGFSVSQLEIPGFEQPWETYNKVGKPSHISSSLDIMIHGPLGGSAFNNEFGRPCITGYFRTFTQVQSKSEDSCDVRGYHKPIMIAGGLGNIREMHVHKKPVSVGAKLIVLGGPSMLIGLGGGAASSMASGQSSAELDFASVQRENPEIQRRCQEVIDRCCAMGEDSPILAIHDVGAGGLSNALPEIVHDSGKGAIFDLRSIPSLDPSMSPMELWCNESQERYVLAINQSQLSIFESICLREKCPFAVVGEATDEQKLVLEDKSFRTKPVDLPLSMLFGKPPKMHRQSNHLPPIYPALTFNVNLDSSFLTDAIHRVLRFPCASSKSFLITIGDRSVTGLVARDQFVGKWQVPVADCGVTASSYDSLSGEAMAMGERTPLALINPAASTRMALAESLLNIVAANISSDDDGDAVGCIRVSANWMSSANQEGEGASLYDGVEAIGLDLCPALGITIPVGKDSMSMKTQWKVKQQDVRVSSPLSLIVTAYGPVKDVRKTWTADIKKTQEESYLILFHLSSGMKRMGGSCLAQVYNEIGNECPNVESADILKEFFNFCQWIRNDGNQYNDLILAYHDRSDGGLITTLLEMCFAGHSGLKITDIPSDALSYLFNEELGAVVQIRKLDFDRLKNAVMEFAPELESLISVVGIVDPANHNIIELISNDTVFASYRRTELHRIWSETSYHMQSLRDNPECAKEEFDSLLDENDPGLSFSLTFDPNEKFGMTQEISVKPKVAILREQGVNGHAEMAYAFYRAGFDPVDVHMSDLFSGQADLSSFQGLAACGGFSYGDVLGAGSGWAKSILLHSSVKEQFQQFFHRPDTFSLGICNGCQMLSQLNSLIAKSDESPELHWPRFVKNKSERFESRVCMVEIIPGSAASKIWFNGMEGTRMPIVVSHGEGRTLYSKKSSDLDHLKSKNLPALRYIDNYGKPTEKFPRNPNGSEQGYTGFSSADGRILMMMPHPERVVRLNAMSWNDRVFPLANNSDSFDDSPWQRMFRNVRIWLG